MDLIIDVPLPTSLPLLDAVAYVQRAEKLGFDGLGVPDHPEHGRDVFVMLAHLAQRTERIMLYPSVTNPVVRHPLTLANQVNTLNEIAPGRVKLALAPGDAALQALGKRPATIAEMGAAVSTIRRLLRGEAVEGYAFSVKPTGSPPPVVVAGSRRRITELAGEIADEALLMAGLEPEMLALAQGYLETGAGRSGRSLEAFPVTHYTLVSVDEDLSAARERTRGWLHLWLKQGQFAPALEQVGMELPPYPLPDDIPAAVLARLCDALFLVATPGTIVERFLRLQHSGVDHVACLIPGGALEARRTLEILGERVLPVLG
jgi:alkanesulfonate monooxygenase SsuD/methylene tetrahydromethanopterin reductase-like flavin-dependent oxidoreductase (luciferase family)